MAAGDQRMIAHMGVSMERELHATAHIAIVGPASFVHFVAHDGVGKPSDRPLEHVVVVEFACQSASALWLRSIADFDRKRDDLDGAVLPGEISVAYHRIRSLQASLDEADRIGPEQKLPIPSDVGRLPSGLTLGIQVPGDVTVDKLLEARLALDREAGAAATGRVVPLNAHIVRYCGF